MQTSGNLPYRDEFEALFRRLLERGWISSFYFHDNGAYGVKWTEKGWERARWVNEVVEDLELGIPRMGLLMVLCRAQGPGAMPCDPR